jgi:hypothetical protein
MQEFQVSVITSIKLLMPPSVTGTAFDFHMHLKYLATAKLPTLYVK